MAAALRSGQVAAAAGVNLQTLRYYERRGLLDEPDRSLGGHRLYPEETVTTLRAIKAAQRVGFTLDEVADLLNTARHRHRPGEGGAFRDRAEEKLAGIEVRITDLQAIAQVLRDAIAAGCQDLTECASIPGCPLSFGARPSQP